MLFKIIAAKTDSPNIERIIRTKVKNPEIAVELIKQFNKWEKIPKILFEKVGEDQNSIIHLIDYALEKNFIVPSFLLNKLEDSYNINSAITKYKNKNKAVPELLKNKLKESNPTAYMNEYNIPLSDMIEGIAGNAKAAEEFYYNNANEDFSKMPELIIEKFLSSLKEHNSEPLFNYLNYIKYNDIPSYIINKIQNYSGAYLEKFIEKYKKYNPDKNLPEQILNKALEDGNSEIKISAMQDVDLTQLNEAQKRLILSDSYLSFGYAKKLGFKNVPKKILNRIYISKRDEDRDYESEWSLNKELMKRYLDEAGEENTPKIFLKFLKLTNNKVDKYEQKYNSEYNIKNEDENEDEDNKNNELVKVRQYGSNLTMIRGLITDEDKQKIIDSDELVKKIVDFNSPSIYRNYDNYILKYINKKGFKNINPDIANKIINFDYNNIFDRLLDYASRYNSGFEDIEPIFYKNRNIQSNERYDKLFRLLNKNSKQNKSDEEVQNIIDYINDDNSVIDDSILYKENDEKLQENNGEQK